METRFAIADNNPIRRDGICAILEQEHFNVRYTQSCSQTLTAHLDDVDILIWGSDQETLVDKNLIAKLKWLGSHLKIMIIDQDRGLQPAIKAIHAGAHAYVTESVQREELLFAIKYLQQGKKYIDPSLTIRLFDKLSDFEEHICTLKTDLPLSDKEKEVLDLMVCGYANKEIAYRLFTTKRNVENMRQNLIDKTGAKDNLSLIFYRLHKEFIAS